MALIDWLAVVFRDLVGIALHSFSLKSPWRGPNKYTQPFWGRRRAVGWDGRLTAEAAQIQARAERLQRTGGENARVLNYNSGWFVSEFRDP